MKPVPRATRQIPSHAVGTVGSDKQMCPLMMMTPPHSVARHGPVTRSAMNPPGMASR